MLSTLRRIRGVLRLGPRRTSLRMTSRNDDFQDGHGHGDGHGDGNGRISREDSSEAARAWQIWIDTGGTFTDCIARDPVGELHRCKVLSSGALRDRVEAIEDGGLRLRGGSSLPDGFLEGMEISLLGETNDGTIQQHDATSGIVRLTGPVPESLRPGSPVEDGSNPPRPQEFQGICARMYETDPAT